MGKQRYAILREVFPALSAQAAIPVVRKVADAYQKDKKTLRKFESLGSITYDLRILSWKKTQHGETDNAARGIAGRAYGSTPIAAMPEMALAASPRLWPWGC